MYLQVKNNVRTSFNQIRSNKDTLIKDVRTQGWKLEDCTVSEIRIPLVETIYRGADGKNIPAGKKQYRSRAKAKNNLNTTGVKTSRTSEEVVIK
jgi:hypothetical protein